MHVHVTPRGKCRLKRQSNVLMPGYPVRNIRIETGNKLTLKCTQIRLLYLRHKNPFDSPNQMGLRLSNVDNENGDTVTYAYRRR